MITTTNLALNEPAYNSTSPTWDQPLNYNSTILDQMFGNTTSVSVNTGGTPTYTNITAPSATAAGSTSQAMRFNLTGGLAANQTVLLPQGVAGMWVFTNSTSGAYTVTIGSNNGSNAAAGTTVAAPQGYSSIFYSDGTNVKKADDGLTSSGIVSSFNAGTTGFTPSTASTGAVTLAGTLNVANGGTGSTSLAANNVILGNGTSALQTVAPGTSGNLLTSNGTTWSSQAPSGGLGINQTWTNVTSSRSLFTTYTNSTSNPIFISVNCTVSGSNSAMAIIVAGNVVSSQGYGGNGFTVTASTIVPSGSTYSVNSSSLNSWWELR
jgi:hypothetical protein